MPSPWKVSPAPSLSACTSFLNERSIAWSCARRRTSITALKRMLPANGGAPLAAACLPARRRPELLPSLRMPGLGPGQTGREIRIAKIGKRLLRRGAVEWAIAVVRHRSLPRRPPHGHGRVVHRRDSFGDVAEAVHASGRHVEHPPAAMHQDASDDLCHVVDEHVVALLLALAEQDDLLPGGGEP